MVADPATFRVLPWADSHRLAAVRHLFSERQAGAVLDPRALSRRAARGLRRRGFDYLAGLEVEFHLFRLDDPRLATETLTWPAEAPAVEHTTHGFQYLTEARFDQVDPIVADAAQDRAGARPAAALARGRAWARASTSSPSRPSVGLAAADTMVLFRSAMKQVGAAARPSGELHVPAADCPTRSPAAGTCISRCSTRNRGATCSCRTTRPSCCRRSAGRFSPGCSRTRGAAAAFTTPTHQRLQALSRRQLDGADPRDLGARQPRRHDPRAGRAGRSGDASGEPRRRAARQSVSLHGVADPRRPRRHRAQATPRAVRRHALRDAGRAAAGRIARRSARGARDAAHASAPASATRSSTYFLRIKRRRDRALRRRNQRAGECDRGHRSRSPGTTAEPVEPDPDDRDGVVLRQRRHGDGQVGFRAPQRRHPPDDLAGHAERFAARRQHRHRRTG